MTGVQTCALPILAIGIGQHSMPFAEAGRTYVLLTIGDGLVAQIPALFLSLATAIIVTRVTTAESMSEQAGSQLSNPPALFIASGILTVIGMVPGMPHLVFLLLAGITAGLAFMALRKQIALDPTLGQQQEAAPEAPKELDWDDVEQVDLIVRSHLVHQGTEFFPIERLDQFRLAFDRQVFEDFDFARDVAVSQYPPDLFIGQFIDDFGDDGGV